MPKFPFTNYHELNLDWILKKVNALFDASEENARTIRTYDTRLNSAEHTATNAETAATSAQQLADAAAANADNALSVAGTADSKADSALTAATNAAGAVAGALTTAREAQQTAAAAVATANDAAATASSLESLANTANQNATAAVETAGAAVTTANNAAAAAQTADQKAVAAQQTANSAQQTANSAQSAATTNAGNISTLQTDVSNLNRQISELETDFDAVTGALNNKADVIIDNASGSIASFADGADGMPVKSLVVNIEPVQTGSGDPSPDNIRPISGHTGAVIYHSGADLTNPETISFTFPTEAGTVYGGTLDVTNGVLTVDRAIVDLGDLSWFYDTTTFPDWKHFRAIINDKEDGWNNGIMEQYRLTSGQYTRTEDFVFTCVPYYSSKNVLIRDSRYTDATSFKQAVTGQKYVYKLATPQSFTHEGQAVTTIYGQNNIWTDVGTVDVEYPADTKLYIDGKIAELQALVLEN